MIYLILILALVILVVLIVLFKGSYSFRDFFSPFSPTPKRMYQHLSPENKCSFWNVAASVILGILTCWLGFSVQIIVYNATQKESVKLAHYQVVDRFRPLYLELMNDSATNEVMEKFISAIGYGGTNQKVFSKDEAIKILNSKNSSITKQRSSEGQLLAYISDQNNWKKIYYTMGKAIEISGSIAPYLEEKEKDKLLTNNSFMVTCMHLIDALSGENKISQKVFIDTYATDFIKHSRLNEVQIKSNTYEMYTTLYNLYLESYGLDSITKKAATIMYIITAGLKPFAENNILIVNSFSPHKDFNPILLSIMILLICFLLGYCIFRILILRLFDINSMEPNPSMSQTELNKLMRKIKIYETEKKQMEINIDSQMVLIKELRLEIERNNDKILMYEKQIEEMNKNIQENED